MSFKGWERYPVNLPHLADHEDLSLLSTLISKAAGGLFSPCKFEFRLESSAFDSKREQSQEFRSDVVVRLDGLEEILKQHVQSAGTHIVYLNQDHTWAPFNISEVALRKTFTFFEVSPSFLRIMFGFGKPRCQSAVNLPSSYDIRLEEKCNGSQDFEICYEIQYISKTGRDSWPWSLRKMGVSQKHRSPHSSSWIFLQPAKQVSRLSKTLHALSKNSTTLADAHLLLFRATLGPWKPFLRCCGNEIREKNNQIRRGHRTVDLETNLTALQDLHWQSEILQDSIAALESSKQTLTALKQLFEGTGQKFTSMLHLRFHQILCEFTVNEKFASDLIAQTKQLSDLITTMLSSRHEEALVRHTASMDTLTKMCQSDGRLLLELGEAAKGDSRAMKQIASITMIYLPGSFMAVRIKRLPVSSRTHTNELKALFSTGFVTAFLSNGDVTDQRQVTIHAATFTTVTVVLMVFTFLKTTIWNRSSIRPRQVMP